MTELYLIRHAQAEGNRYHMMQGHWDGGVTTSTARASPPTPPRGGSICG